MVPKYEDIVKEVDCVRCDKKGAAFRSIKAPCPFCLGQGVLIKPSGAPDARVGPPE
jgi:hypothetical protein